MSLSSESKKWMGGLSRLALPILCAIWIGHEYQGRKAISHSSPAEAHRDDTGTPPDLLIRSDGDLSSALLIDSIISIIQGYYVDDDRVDNQQLLSLVLRGLEDLQQVTVVSGPSSYLVKPVASNGAPYRIDTSQELSYERLLEILVDLGKEIDKAKLAGSSSHGGGDFEEPGTSLVLNAILNTLDAHSALLSREAYRELKQGTEGTFGGLGVLVGIRDRILTVIKPLPRSPASRIGIHKHDRILSINGVETFGQSLDQLVEYMRGEPGTSVHLRMLPAGADASHEMDLMREVIRVDSVSAADVSIEGQSFLKLQIESFSSRTSRDVLAAIARYRDKNSGDLSGIILDLRNNPGGLLDQAVQVADIFLESGIIVETKGRRKEVEAATAGIDELNFPLVILINGDSASASEIVAGALQDQNRAIVIGQQSFGKGSVQTVFELPGEQALKLTIARYYTPSGRSIQNIGITPDVALQPVIRGNKNSNLLGPYRYKSERFLENHLLVPAAQTGQRENGITQSLFQGYYLTDHSDMDEEVPFSEDRELELALTLLLKVRQTYHGVMPDSGDRAGHWLALAGPEIHKKMDNWGNEVSIFLRDKFQLTWGANLGSASNSLSIEIPRKDNLKGVAGKTLKLPFQVVNRSSKAVDQISVFFRSKTGEILGQEQLVGRIDGNSARTGAFAVQIPHGFPSTQIPLEFGTAVASSLLPLPLQRATLAVEQGEASHLDVSLKITSLDGATSAGPIVANSASLVKMELVNTSSVDAHDIQAQLTNLSGSQIFVEEGAKRVASLGAGEKATVFFKINGGRRILNSVVSLGASVNSEDFDRDFTKQFDFDAVPARVAKIENTMSH